MVPKIFTARDIAIVFGTCGADIVKVFTTYQTFLFFCRNLNLFIKKKLKYFTRPKQISPDLSGVSGDFRIAWWCIKQDLSVVDINFEHMTFDNLFINMSVSDDSNI